MKWEIDTLMKDGQIARAYDDNGEWCVMHTIEGKAQYIETCIGPVEVEHVTGRRKFLVTPFSPKVNKSLSRRDWPAQLTIWVLMFIAVFLLTVVLYKLWEALF